MSLHSSSSINGEGSTPKDPVYKILDDLEVTVVELKRKNKELQHEKRELMVKLNAAESRAAELSNMTEVRILD